MFKKDTPKHCLVFLVLHTDQPKLKNKTKKSVNRLAIVLLRYCPLLL